MDTILMDGWAMAVIWAVVAGVLSGIGWLQERVWR